MTTLHSDSTGTPIWRLRHGADRRFRSGHPWIYSNELSASPKGIEPGAAVELQDAKGQFLARGYGNPASLIAFRALSRDAQVADPGEASLLVKALMAARSVRETAGLTRASYRLCFGEADRLPGLIIDRYLLSGGQQIFAVQAHTAGAQRLLPGVFEALRELAEGQPTGIVLRNDLGIRRLEGLEKEEPRVVQAIEGVDLRDARILVAQASSGDGAEGGTSTRTLEFATDLLEGQKTGFFLDQFGNIQLAARRLGALRPREGKRIRILELCCYVGHWSAQLARMYRDAGLEVEVTAVDSSEKALAFAKRNIEAQGARCVTLRADVLKDLGSLSPESYDIVISDPPALIKGRKDIGPGTHAYLQLNTQVFRLVKKGGAVVSCSCSSLLVEEEFAQVLAKAASRNSVDARWIARGSQSPDHPILAEFPEGRYLKCWIGALPC